MAEVNLDDVFWEPAGFPLPKDRPVLLLIGTTLFRRENADEGWKLVEEPYLVEDEQGRAYLP